MGIGAVCAHPAPSARRSCGRAVVAWRGCGPCTWVRRCGTGSCRGSAVTVVAAAPAPLCWNLPQGRRASTSLTMAMMGRRQSRQVALWAAQGWMHSLQKQCPQGSTRAASASGPRQMVQLSSTGAFAGCSWRVWLMASAAAPVWRCLLFLGRCSDVKWVSSVSGPQHLPRQSLAESQRLAAHQQHLNDLRSTRRTSMPCLQPGGSQHLTCSQKDINVSCSSKRLLTSWVPAEGPICLTCHTEGPRCLLQHLLVC